MYEFFSYLELLKEYYIESSITFLICTFIFLLCKFIYYKTHEEQETKDKIVNNNTSTPSLNISTFTGIHKFKIQSTQLCSNNAIYLTNFKQDGLLALLLHIVFGYYLYYILPINFFCLLVALGQLYEYNQVKTFIPLNLFAFISTFNHVYSMSKLLKQQYQENHKKIDKYNYTKKIEKKKTISQMDLKRGDFLKLSEGDEIPADLLLINPCSVAVQELKLTGEDIILNKTGIPIPLEEYETTGLFIYHKQNTGSILFWNKEEVSTINYTSKNMLFRGTKIVDISSEQNYLLGLVIETGNDCQIYNINNKNQLNPPKTSLQKKIVNICLLNLYIMLLLAGFCGIIIYAQNENMKLWTINRKMILLFNTMIPLSLQFFFNSACLILSKRIERENQVQINRNGINAFQFNPEYIVSDKTGTITTNQMDLNKIYSVNNTSHYMTLLNVLACSEVQPHSKTRKLLKNDLLEEKLLSHLLPSTNNILITNRIDDEEGAGLISLKNNNTEETNRYRRIYYKPFDYELKVKLSILEIEDKYFLFIQGVPEAINEYSLNHNKLSSLLQTVESDKNLPSNTYQRIIAGAYKEIEGGKEEIELIQKNPLQVLKDFKHLHLYVFHDFIVEGIEYSIQNLLVEKNKDFTLLTGDKMSSAIHVGKKIGIVTASESNLILVDTLEDLCSSFYLNLKKNTCLVINGKLLDVFIQDPKNSGKFYTLIQKTRQRIIYRSTPAGKQQFVSYLQKMTQKEVLMVGDESNDIAALIQSQVGICIKSQESTNLNVQNVSEVVIDNWNKIPALLEDFRRYQVVISNISKWVLMKHMITAFSLVTMLYVSGFKRIKDPTDPYLMALLNGSMWCAMYIYCYYEEIPSSYPSTTKFRWSILWGILLGSLNGGIIFNLVGSEINTGIHILLCVQVLQLLFHLYKLTHNKNKIITNSFSLIGLAWIIWLFSTFIFS